MLAKCSSWIRIKSTTNNVLNESYNYFPTLNQTKLKLNFGPQIEEGFIQKQRKNSQRGKELNKFCSPSRSDDLCHFSCHYPFSSFYVPNHCTKASPYLQCLGSGSFCPDPDRTLFTESGSGSDKNPDPERPKILFGSAKKPDPFLKNPDPDPRKNAQKL